MNLDEMRKCRSLDELRHLSSERGYTVGEAIAKSADGMVAVYPVTKVPELSEAFLVKVEVGNAIRVAPMLHILDTTVAQGQKDRKYSYYRMVI